jgi:VanZ family protein
VAAIAATRGGVSSSARLVLYGLPPLLWAGLLFYLSSQSSLPSLSTLPQFDKVEHLGAYGVLGALTYRAFAAFGAPSRRAVLLAFIAGALYGVSDELHQIFTPNRTADVFDALADGTGSGLGATAWWLLVRIVA